MGRLVFSSNVSVFAKLLQTKHLLMVAIALEGLGGLLFTVGSSLGAYLLVSKNAIITCLSGLIGFLDHSLDKLGVLCRLCMLMPLLYQQSI